MADAFESDDPRELRHTCKGVRRDLKLCMLESECVKKEKKTPRQCLKEKSPLVDDECYRLKTLFFECKRSLLDTRRRFRGRRGY